MHRFSFWFSLALFVLGLGVLEVKVANADGNCDNAALLVIPCQPKNAELVVGPGFTCASFGVPGAPACPTGLATGQASGPYGYTLNVMGTNTRITVVMSTVTVTTPLGSFQVQVPLSGPCYTHTTCTADQEGNCISGAQYPVVRIVYTTVGC